MKKHKTKLIIIPIIAVFIAVLIGYFISASKPDPDRSCPNCSSFTRYYLDDYADEHDGYFPKGGKTPLDSLAQCIKEEKEVHFFTSHLRTMKCIDYWKKHKSLNEDVTVYRYNEGLNEADPGNLVIMYYYKDSKTYKGIGRFVLRNYNSKFRFMTTEEFQQAQKETVDFLKKRNERPEEKKEVREELKLVIDCKNPKAGIYDFSFLIVNKGKKSANIELVDEGSIISCSGTSGQQRGNYGNSGNSFTIKPGERKIMPGFATAKLSTQINKANVTYTNFSFKTKNASGGGGLSEGTPDKDKYWIRIHLPVKVSMGKIKDLNLLLTSETIQYLLMSTTDNE